MNNPQSPKTRLELAIHKLTRLCIFLFVVVMVQFVALIFQSDLKRLFSGSKKIEKQPVADKSALMSGPVAVFQGEVWKAPALEELQKETNYAQLAYGRELIINTSKYFGPKGSVATIGNGMNCQNCHLEAGTVPFGNNFAAVAATYPKYRPRSGKTEDAYKRVADCFERSLNGVAPAKESKEMEAMVSYILRLGKSVPVGKKPAGSGIYELPYPDVKASPEKGKELYALKCQSCHKSEGEGALNPELTAYTYPPLWGEHSFNTGAGLYRISRLAGYIKTSMPLGATYKAPQLSDEEAWDIAAYIVSLPRPKMDASTDWPKIDEKPVDHPFGPYADNFPEDQHKYGPFAPLVAAKKAVQGK